MGLNTSCSFIQLLILVLGCVRIRAQRTSEEWPFPKCRDTYSCGMVDCREIRIPFFPLDAGYSPRNVICMDNTPNNSSPAYYLLTRCPHGFYNTFQNTSGVCSIPGGNGTDLLFIAGKLATGLHPIDCNFNNSFVYSSAIVVNDDTPYRDVLVYINNTWQQYHNNNTNITVHVGDSLTVVVRGVGNISMINANDPRFICETNFACNMELSLSDVSNRGVECSLRTAAELSDNGRTLTVILDKMDQLNITITVRERPLQPSLPSIVPATASAEHHPQPTSIPATPIISSIEPTVRSDTTSSSDLLSSSVIQPSNTGSPGQGIPTIPPPSSGEGSEGAPAGVIAAVIVAVIGAVVVTLIVIGLIFCIRKKKRVRKKKLHDDAAKHVEEARGAPPTTCSRSSSVRSASSALDERLKDIQDKLEYNIEITEEVNTGVHALNIDKTKSLKRQTSAS